MITTELRVAFTRTGQQLHALEVQPGQRSGKTLCGKYGYVHPDFDHGDATGPVGLALSLNFGCLRCQKELDR